MTRPLVSDWSQFRVAVRNQIAGYVQTSRFWIVFAIILAIGGGLSIAFVIKGGVFVHGAFGATATAYIAGLLGFVSFLAIVTGALFGGDAISTDFGTKSGFFTLALPVKRRVLLGGRFAAALLVSLLLLSIFYAFALFGGIYFYSAGTIPWFNLGLSYLLTLLLLFGILAFAFCLSSVSKSPVIGLVVTILVLLVVFTIIDGVLVRLVASEYLLWSILFAAAAIPAAVEYGLATGSPAVWQSTVIMVLYTVGFLAIALLLYDRQEA
ncbi:MAG: ABC transporter permease [Thermoplasmata archaeon]|nr:ABC transporter permease [Thermoplasmata archaeon]